MPLWHKAIGNNDWLLLWSESSLFASIFLWGRFSILKQLSGNSFAFDLPPTGRPGCWCSVANGGHLKVRCSSFPDCGAQALLHLHPSNQIQELLAEDDAKKLMKIKWFLPSFPFLWRNSSLWRRGKLSVQERGACQGWKIIIKVEQMQR